MADLPIFVIGRGADADYRVDDEYASPRHAIIRALGRGQFTIEDAGSTNGLYLDWLFGWARVYEPVPFEPTMRIRVGRTEIDAAGLLYAFALKVQEESGRG